MKKYINIGIAALFLCGFVAQRAAAQDAQELPGVTVENPTMTRNASLMSISMDLNLSELDLRNNQSVVLVPVIVNGEQEQELPAVSIYGRTRWYQYLRANKAPLGALVYRSSECPDQLAYSQNVPYEEWMNGAHLELRRNDCGCCNTVLAQSGTGVSLGGYNSYQPELHYVKPTAELAKVRELSSSAYVDYPVDRIDIQPDFRNNRAELSRITSMIDSLRGDWDITVSSLTIKGFASPEGDYAHNEYLAQSRTEALKKYVDGLYTFGDGFITTSYEAEDWAGLREQVATSSLANKEAILAIIDDATLSPDTKDWRIKKTYADDYNYMLEQMFPKLRRADYTVVYTVRNYTDLATIRRVMAEAPQKLSLEEMFLLAESYEKGSEEYNEVFETAVRMFPNDETANLNAANVAMARGDLARAERYLSKAGNSSEAVYARRILAEMQKLGNN